MRNTDRKDFQLETLFLLYMIASNTSDDKWISITFAVIGAAYALALLFTFKWRS